MKKAIAAVILTLIFLSIGVILLIKQTPFKSRKGDEKKMIEVLTEKKVLMIVAPENFRDEEFFQPKEILQQGGVQITVASKGVSQAKGMFGRTTQVDKDITQVSVDNYEAIIFVGGTGSSIYFEDSLALNLAKKFYDSGKLVGAICIAPSILANAGILQGKRATAFSSEAENLRAKGAQYTGENITVDGKIITASGPQAAKQFGEEILKKLSS
jgi:protease I